VLNYFLDLICDEHSMLSIISDEYDSFLILSPLCYNCANPYRLHNRKVERIVLSGIVFRIDSILPPSPLLKTVVITKQRPHCRHTCLIAEEDLNPVD
jgi:hypothetical protein